MTTAADHSAVEAAFEAVLAGRPVPEPGASLAAFTEAVRSSASAPGRPNAALAALLADGLLTDSACPSVRTAGAAGRSRAPRARIRGRIAMFFPALLATIVPAGAVAQAATGAGIVLVAFTGAGAAGALPDSLQHGFAAVASTVGIRVDDPQPAADQDSTSVTSSPTPDGADVGSPRTGTEADVASPPPAVEDGYTLEDWEKGPAVDQSFGDWVSEGARHGYADGAVISREAEKKGIPLEDGTTEQTTATDSEAERTPSPTPTRTPGSNGHGNAGSNRGSSGDGNANGNGNGNGNGTGSANGNAKGNGHGSGHGDD